MRAEACQRERRGHARRERACRIEALVVSSPPTLGGPTMEDLTSLEPRMEKLERLVADIRDGL